MWSHSPATGGHDRGSRGESGLHCAHSLSHQQPGAPRHLLRIRRALPGEEAPGTLPHSDGAAASSSGRGGSLAAGHRGTVGLCPEQSESRKWGPSASQGQCPKLTGPSMGLPAMGLPRLSCPRSSQGSSWRALVGLRCQGLEKQGAQGPPIAAPAPGAPTGSDAQLRSHPALSGQGELNSFT